MSGRWLPDIISLSDSGGVWADYLEVIYQRFRIDFVLSKPVVRGVRCGLKRHPVVREKEATFWHFISDGAVEEERLPDFRRCERIGWPRAIIDALDTDRVLSWKNERKGEARLNICLPDFSYLVVLADRKEYMLPWTAYCVQEAHRRKKLSEDYKRFDPSKWLTPPP